MKLQVPRSLASASLVTRFVVNIFLGEMAPHVCEYGFKVMIAWCDVSPRWRNESMTIWGGERMHKTYDTSIACHNKLPMAAACTLNEGWATAGESALLLILAAFGQGQSGSSFSLPRFIGTKGKINTHVNTYDDNVTAKSSGLFWPPRVFIFILSTGHTQAKCIFTSSWLKLYTRTAMVGKFRLFLASQQ